MGRRSAISPLLSGINLSDYRMIIYALALIVMMIVRPEGLFGVREIWDYLPPRLATTGKDMLA